MFSRNIDFWVPISRWFQQTATLGDSLVFCYIIPIFLGGRIDHGHHATLAQKALDETVEFSKAIQKAVDLTDQRDTLIVVTSDHAHTMSFSGYPQRDNNIFGMAGTGRDDLPYASLSYANGPSYKVEDGARVNLRMEHMSKWRDEIQSIAASLSSLFEMILTRLFYRWNQLQISIDGAAAVWNPRWWRCWCFCYWAVGSLVYRSYRTKRYSACHGFRVLHRNWDVSLQWRLKKNRRSWRICSIYGTNEQKRMLLWVKFCTDWP